SVTLSAWPTQYYKGWLYAGTKGWIQNILFTCANEDKNRNGILDIGEDINGNGTLEPGLPAVLTPASVTTDASGAATFTVTYGQQYALWVDVDLTAKATVAGTESSGVYHFAPLAIAAADMNSTDATPAAYMSPFGLGYNKVTYEYYDCTDPR
ncbi:MAG TPA: hypothetical protein VGC24_11225, partial [Burkholderiaceae bacterium]